MWQAQIRTSDRLVIQTGNSLGERDGCIVVDLADEDYAGLKAALSEPNGGVLMDEDGACTVLDPEPERA